MERPLGGQSEQRWRDQERPGRGHTQMGLRKTRGCLASRLQRTAQPGYFGPYPTLVGGYSKEFRVMRVPVAIPTPPEPLSYVCSCAHVPCCMGRGQRTTYGVHPFLPPLPGGWGSKLRLPGLCDKCLYLLSHPPTPHLGPDLK